MGLEELQYLYMVIHDGRLVRFQIGRPPKRPAEERLRLKPKPLGWKVLLFKYTPTYETIPSMDGQ